MVLPEVVGQLDTCSTIMLGEPAAGKSPMGIMLGMALGRYNKSQGAPGEPSARVASDLVFQRRTGYRDLL